MTYVFAEEAIKNSVFNEEQVDPKAPSMDLYFVESKSCTDCANESEVRNLRLDEILLQELVKILEHFAGVKGDSLLLVVLHGLVFLNEVPHQLHYLVIFSLNVLFELLVNFMQTDCRQVIRQQLFAVLWFLMLLCRIIK